MFLIKKLIFSGKNVETSEIEFKDGLNIVYGPSNTGKTYVAESIDYMLGGSEYPIDDTNGYTTITILVKTANGTVEITRVKDENKAHVISNVSNIETGDYVIKGKGHVTLSDIWLEIFGIVPPVDVYQTESLKTASLTTRVFNETFIIKEDNIHKKKSIVSKDKTNITYIKAAFLYLLNSENYIENDDEDNKTKAIKRKALEAYLNEQLGYIEAQREELNKKAKVDTKEVQSQIDDAINELSEYQNQMNYILCQNRELYVDINKLYDSISENESMQKKYYALKTQYSSDLKRLRLIIDGEVHKGSIKKPARCPFCNGELPKREEESCVDAAKVEIDNLLPRIKDLEGADSDLKNETNSLKNQLKKLNDQKAENDSKINEELKPKISEIKKVIDELKIAIENSKEASMLLQFESNYKKKLQELTVEKKDIVEFKPNDLLGTSFVSEMNISLDNMLKECNYENYNSSYFDINSFDVVVNGKKKSTQGKGFRAFLNTAVAFCIHDYFMKHADHYVNVFVADSPILTLKERDDEAERQDKKIADTMKEALMKYFVEHQAKKQIIIIENEIPHIDYKNTNLIHFSKSNEGRYGLLKSIKQ